MATFTAFWDSQQAAINGQVQAEYASLASIRSQLSSDKSPADAAVIIEKIHTGWTRFTMVFVRLGCFRLWLFL